MPQFTYVVHNGKGKWEGKSTYNFPDPLTTPIGSELYTTDTGIEYLLDDSGNWIPNEPSDAISIPGSTIQLTNSLGGLIFLDSFRAAIIEGLAYKASWGDTTGITAGTSYFYWVKNTNTNKNIWLRSIDFNPGTLLIKIIKGGAFTLGGTAYNPDTYIDMANTGVTTNGSPYITGTFDTAKVKANMLITGTGIPARTYVYAVTSNLITMTNVATASASGVALTISVPAMIARNLNSNYLANVPGLKLWYQNVLGTIAYADGVIDALYNTIEVEMDQPSSLSDHPVNIIKPGDEFMAIITNYGSNTIPYRLDVEWSEVEVI